MQTVAKERASQLHYCPFLADGGDKKGCMGNAVQTDVKRPRRAKQRRAIRPRKAFRNSTRCVLVSAS